MGTTAEARGRQALRGITAAAAMLAVALGAPAAAQACAGADSNPAQASSSAMRNTTLCLVNERRSARGLPALRHNTRLALAAKRHARDMVQRRYFAHDSLSGEDFVARVRRTGYTTGVRWRLGENLGWGGGEMASPGALVKAWMDSPAHRNNVLGSFEEIGIALTPGAPVAGHPQAFTYATEFGARN